MRAELKLLFDRLETTLVYVTHDQAEAMTMSDRVAIFNKGVVQQIGTPLELHNAPVNLFVAGFLGWLP
jgi:ABC-type sugar transport system ATPase subunit